MKPALTTATPHTTVFVSKKPKLFRICFPFAPAFNHFCEEILHSG